MTVSRSPLNADDVSVIVVDDARFTLEMLRRTLKSAAFYDIRVATSASQALEMMRERSCNILLADWMMPEMDGLSLTKRVRQHDEETNHYTYIVLLTAKEGVESLTAAFEHGVDDFINKSPDNKELLARIRAAGRISELQNDLLKANRRLTELNRQMEERNSFDVVTGLGNRAYMERQFDNLMRHTESRGGAACCAVIRVNEFDLLQRRHGDKVAEEIIETTAIRLQQTVRPLDIVTRIGDHTFGVLMFQEDVKEVHPNAFRRIHQALNLRAYKTAAGFLAITSAISLCGITPNDAEKPAPGEVIDHAAKFLDEAKASGRVHIAAWPPKSTA